MLEPNSVDQILRVLDLLRQNRRLGFDTPAACSRAIQQVAKEAGVRYQTIGDGCRRRLGLVDMSEFHRLADEWLKGDGNRLAAVIRRSAASSAASRVASFFATGGAAVKAVDAPVGASASRGGAVGIQSPIKLTVEDADARMLRVVAQLEGREPALVAVDLLRIGMRDRLRAALG